MNDSPPVPADRVRQVGVTLSEIFCVIGTLVGVGVLGTAVSDTAGGALSAEATLLAPAGTAFSIWSVVYLGLAAFTVWQWLPAQRADPRMRSTGWLAAASMVLNASWLLVTQQGWIWFSVVVIAALLATLVAIIRLLTLHPARSVPERVVVDGTFGLYLGWVAVATCANLAAALVASDVGVGAAAAVVVIAIVTVAGVVLAVRYGARWTVAAASAWGLAWIAVGRLGAEPRSTTTALVALVAAAVVLGAVAAVRAGRLAPASAPS